MVNSTYSMPWLTTPYASNITIIMYEYNNYCASHNLYLRMNEIMIAGGIDSLVISISTGGSRDDAYSQI